MSDPKIREYKPRKHHRRAERVEVYICVRNDCGTAMTRDVSEGGIAVDLSTAKGVPDIKVGSIVSTRSVDAPHSAAIIGKVVRMNEDELAIEFII
jgi:hypothetical protein